jgi:anti-anti-sigma factor
MNYTVSKEPDLARVCVAGEVDASCADELSTALRTVIDHERPPRLEVDLSAVSFIDSIGIRTLAFAYEYAKEHNCGFVVRGPRRNVRRVLELTGLLPMLLVESEG